MSVSLARLFKSAKAAVFEIGMALFGISAQKFYANDGYNENRVMVESCDILFAFAGFR
ncbi:MAG: hypothetical protein WAT62_01130 [Candidatus Nanogingivalis sp.]